VLLVISLPLDFIRFFEKRRDVLFFDTPPVVARVTERGDVDCVLFTTFRFFTEINCSSRTDSLNEVIHSPMNSRSSSSLIVSTAAILDSLLPVNAA
jgi:hypothetical protein